MLHRPLVGLSILLLPCASIAQSLFVPVNVHLEVTLPGDGSFASAVFYGPQAWEGNVSNVVVTAHHDPVPGLSSAILRFESVLDISYPSSPSTESSFYFTPDQMIQLTADGKIELTVVPLVYDFLPTTLKLDFTYDGVAVAAIPEPEIYAMLGVGLGLIGWVGRRKKLRVGAAA